MRCCLNISTSKREEIACEAFGCLDCISAEYFYAAAAAKLCCDNIFIDGSSSFIRMTKKLCRSSEEWGRAVHAALKISEHFGGYLRMNDLMSIELDRFFLYTVHTAYKCRT